MSLLPTGVGRGTGGRISSAFWHQRNAFRAIQGLRQGSQVQGGKAGAQEEGGGEEGSSSCQSSPEGADPCCIFYISVVCV